MRAPRVDQINLVVGDVEAVARFLVDLGVDLPRSSPAWDAHHRPVPAATSAHVGHDHGEPAFGIDLDSAAFAGHWGGLPPTFNGVVVNMRVDDRTDVDDLHDRAVSLGGRSLKSPYDAFWGSRYCVVQAPGPLAVGIMSVPDAAHRSAPPDPSSLG